ncbi:restriction endonuclease [Virgibacillus doumboii]|uniref:restriction endonuclease n=1 Tax=Virgibacillus doumboii TaxID=2697503 RepID=UPI0013DF0D9C|nr:restriction endonuclease [Virgibacillus doumboii]
MLTLIVVQAFVIIGLLWFMRKQNEREAALLSQKINSSMELKKTMAMGLYYRFNFPHKKDENGDISFDKASDLFIKQLDFELEDFCASVIEEKHGGNAVTTARSGDFGVDFEHTRDDGLYLGQVKAYKNDLGYEPIALIHSNMIKRNAEGGYVISTSGFSKSAKEYAKGLNIELIDGVELVQYWLETMESTVYSPAANEYV